MGRGPTSATGPLRGDASALGLTVGEYQPTGRAAAEFRRVVEWLTLSSLRSRNSRRRQMSKSAPDLEQALALTSTRRGAPGGRSSPTRGRPPRVMIRHPRRSGGSGPVAGNRLRAEGPAPRPGLCRAQRRLRPAPQARNRPLTAARQRARRPITAHSVNEVGARVHGPFPPESDSAPAAASPRSRPESTGQRGRFRPRRTRGRLPRCSTRPPSPGSSPPAASPVTKPRPSRRP